MTTDPTADLAAILADWRIRYGKATPDAAEIIASMRLRGHTYGHDGCTAAVQHVAEEHHGPDYPPCAAWHSARSFTTVATPTGDRYLAVQHAYDTRSEGADYSHTESLRRALAVADATNPEVQRLRGIVDAAKRICDDIVQRAMGRNDETSLATRLVAHEVRRALTPPTEPTP